MEKSFDVKSIMDIIYGEKSTMWEHKGFVCADDMRAAGEEEVIQIPEEDKEEINYQTFTRSRKKEKNS